MKAKLGLPQDLNDEVSSPVINDLVLLMQEQSVDYTSFLRALNQAARGDMEPVRQTALDLEALDTWLEAWRQLSPNADQMDRINPAYIPRNHLVEEALESATDGDFAPFHQLLEVVIEPYHEREGFDRYASPAPASFGTYRTFCGT
jgi:serine/tyrosine/threonine adenylyltransferase